MDRPIFVDSRGGIVTPATPYPGSHYAPSIDIWSPDIAALAKQHNNANIIVLPARFISPETAFETLESFFNAQFEGGRHQRRIDKINI